MNRPPFANMHMPIAYVPQGLPTPLQHCVEPLHVPSEQDMPVPLPPLPPVPLPPVPLPPVPLPPVPLPPVPLPPIP